VRAHLVTAFFVTATSLVAGLGIDHAAASTHEDAFVPYDQPTSDYLADSCKMRLHRRPLGSPVVEDPTCGNIVNFKAPNPPIHELVPFTGWLAWGRRPAVEKAKPDILTIDPYEDLVIRIRRTTVVGGVEIEPKDGATATFTATFYDLEDVPGCLGNVLGSITRTVHGNGGALLFGVNAQPGFRCIKITADGATPYAIAEVRVAAHVHHAADSRR
jgi:hypothetical protein